MRPVSDNSQADDAQAVTVNIMKTIEQRIQQQRQDLDYDQIFTAYEQVASHDTQLAIVPEIL